MHGTQLQRRPNFTKRYVPNSLTAGGRRSPENHGHSVEYRGQAARVRPDGSPSLSGGIKGAWSIRHALGAYDGQWHLWPVMARWDAAEDEAGGEEEGGESECCVCYDRPIDTRLQPCGHVALCRQCAVRLPQRRCPLCRAEIHDMLPAAAARAG